MKIANHLIVLSTSERGADVVAAFIARKVLLENKDSNKHLRQRKPRLPNQKIRAHSPHRR